MRSEERRVGKECKHRCLHSFPTRRSSDLGRGYFPSIPITTEWEEVTVFTNCTGDAATRILFNYGKYAGTIYIDDLYIYWQKSGNTIPLTP